MGWGRRDRESTFSLTGRSVTPSPSCCGGFRRLDTRIRDSNVPSPTVLLEDGRRVGTLVDVPETVAYVLVTFSFGCQWCPGVCAVGRDSQTN